MASRSERLNTATATAAMASTVGLSDSPENSRTALARHKAAPPTKESRKA